MDNDALMRRISAATDHKKQTSNVTPVAPPMPQPQPSVHGGMSPQSRPSLVSSDAREQLRQQAMAAAAQQQSVQPPVASAMPTVDIGIQNQPPHVTAPPIQTAPDPVEPMVQEQTMDPVAVASSQKQLMTFAPPTVENAPAQGSGPRPMRREDRPEAFVVSCTGSTATVQGDTRCVDTITGLTWAVGRMLSIIVGKNRIVGMICDIEMPGEEFNPETKSIMRFHVELQGEVQDTDDGLKFTKGISAYPGVGSTVHQIRAADLASIYAATGSVNAYVGDLSQDESIPALVDVPDMLAKHFAVLGSTGCGKSASVSLLLHAAQETVPDLRTIILDPHNEYSRAFPTANTITQANMDIPFWMFQLEEYAEVLFRGKPIVHEEIDALREFIPNAKIKFRDGEDRVKLRPDSGATVMTADTAAPYRIADLLASVEEEMGLLESQFDRTILKSLKARITAHANDSRYAFMFRHKTIEDIAQQVISNFFCLPGTGDINTIIQMAGMPAEVVNSVASVLCRLSFELAIAAKGNLKILVVCEEAHRYVPAGKDGFEPTRRAIARIAKEGRKYGSFMAIISQRPSELDPTILSQCSTVFSLRLTNDYDQEIIRKAISSSSASTIAFISSLANRECIAFGEGMSSPMRMRFRGLPKEWLPGAEADVFGNSTPVVDVRQSAEVFNHWRTGAH